MGWEKTARHCDTTRQPNCASEKCVVVRNILQRFQQILTLSGKATSEVWTPDLFFPNEKDATFHVVTVPNMLMKIDSNGTVVYSVR